MVEYIHLLSQFLRPKEQLKHSTNFMENAFRLTVALFYLVREYFMDLGWINLPGLLKHYNTFLIGVTECYNSSIQNSKQHLFQNLRISLIRYVILDNMI